MIQDRFASAAPVAIIGGGPVGLTLALTLAHFGVRSVLFERNPTTTSHPKMDITNGRSMELFRKIGVVEALRSVATKPDAPFDVSWITRLNGHELHRFTYGGTADFERRIRTDNDGTQPREAPIRASQIMVEPALKLIAEQHPLIEVRFAVNCEGFTIEGEEVVVHLRRAHDGGAEDVRCAYLVGCDGGGSIIRQQLGIGLTGEARLGERFITHFRSTARDVLQPWGPSWHYQSNLGTLIAQNDFDTWTLLSRLPEGMTAAQADPSDLITRFAGTPFDHMVMVCNPWSPNLLVADAYGQGRVLLAGDSAHQYIPTGGYGMNTGIGDAVDLGWKLAAMLRGFGGRALLTAYEAERRPVGLRNVAGSGRHNAVRVKIAKLYQEPGLDADGPMGDRARADVGKQIGQIGNAENESYGIELGYAYSFSPIIAHQSGVQAPDDPLTYQPSIVPGVRLPSLFLADGTALYDLLGDWFTFIHFGDPAADAFADAATTLNIPLVLLDLSAFAAARELYRGQSLLIRPDMHIAWNAQGGLTSPMAVIKLAAGWPG